MANKIPQTSAQYDETRVIERPDGFYWQSTESGKEFGPFVTLMEATDDMEYADASLEPGESLGEAGDEIGIADWVDPDTGQLAEESIPRLEDH
jgi:hypothetical protein